MSEAKLHTIKQKLKQLTPHNVKDGKYPEWNPVIEKLPIHSIMVDILNGEPVPFKLLNDEEFLVTTILPGTDTLSIIGTTIFGEMDLDEQIYWTSALVGHIEIFLFAEECDDENKKWNLYLEECIRKCDNETAKCKKEKLDVWQKELAERRVKRKEKRRQKWVRTEEKKKNADIKAIVEAKNAGISDTELAALQARKLRESSEMLKSHKFDDPDRELWLRSYCESIRIECERV